MNYSVQIWVDVEAESPEEAKRIVEERARLKWPPVTHIEFECDYNCSRCEDKGYHQEWGSRGESGEVFCHCALGRQKLKEEVERRE